MADDFTIEQDAIHLEDADESIASRTNGESDTESAKDV